MKEIIITNQPKTISIHHIPDNAIIGLQDKKDNRKFFLENYDGNYFLGGMTTEDGISFSSNTFGKCTTLKGSLKYFEDSGWTSYLFDSPRELYEWLAKDNPA